MPTDDELLRLYNPKAEHPNPTHVTGLRAVYDAGQNDAAQDYQTRGEYGIGYEHGVLAAVAAERERCARIAGAETDFTDDIHTEARRRYPVDHTVDDPFGATGEARSDPYGYDEYAREAFLAGALVQHELERTRRLQDAAAIRSDRAPEPATEQGPIEKCRECGREEWGHSWLDHVK